MKLAVSNIAWDAASDENMYAFLQECGFQGLEIAPTRIFPQQPYEQQYLAQEFSMRLRQVYQLSICSMQSIWYGRQEKLFGSPEERARLLEYTKKAIDFAAVMQCGNLVFGCPKNRVRKERAQYGIAVDFFREIGAYANHHHTTLSIEANPPIYQTNFINQTSEAIQLCRDIDCKGIAVNLDCGTMIENGETLEALWDDFVYVNHIHISEPNLMQIQQRKLYTDLLQGLKEQNYQKFVSIEMKKYDDIDILKRAMEYIGEILI